MASSSSNNIYDVIVIGVGGVGSFALRELANRQANVLVSNAQQEKKPLRILGIEQFVPGHGYGSSHGKSRIYRHAYFEHPDYVPLTEYSTKEFFSLQKKYINNDESLGEQAPHVVEGVKDSKLPFIQSCGALVVDYSKPSDSESVVQRCIDAAKEHDVPIQEMNSDALRETYPQFLIKDGMRGVLEPDAGMVCPERAIYYALEDAKQLAKTNGHKLDIMTETEVVRIVPGRDDGEETTIIETRPFGKEATESNSATIYKSSKVIITAGAWASKLIPDLKSHLKVTRQIQGWVDVSFSDQAVETMTNSPAWFLDRGLGKLPMYGIPCNRLDVEKRCRTWHKLALHHRTEQVDDIYNNSHVAVTKEEKKELETAARDWLSDDVIPTSSHNQSDNALDEKSSFFVDALPCMYTTTKDENFIIDSIPNNNDKKQSIWFVAGLSGHGFKMTPALGKAVVDLAIDNKSNELPVDFLRIDRLLQNKIN